MFLRASVVALVAVAALSGCTSSPSTTDPASHAPVSGGSPSASASPSASPSPKVVALPKDCTAIIGAASTSDFATFPLNDPILTDAPTSGVVAPTQPKAGASPDEIVSAAAERYCLWRDPNADITNLELSAAHADPAVISALLAELPGKGYTCTTPHEGRQCQGSSKDPTYQVIVADTVFARDDVVIRVSQANVTTHDLIGSIVATIWK